jgi:N-acetylglucosaminyl-diphospho-decaprenol L-rhamnosyltransferase
VIAGPAVTGVDVSVIIVSWNTRDLLLQCLESLRAGLGLLIAEILVVDNNSSDGSPQAVRDRWPAVRLTANPDNRGLATANNQAARLAHGRYLLFLNSDTIVQPGAIDTLVQLADATPRAGVIGARIENPDGTFQASFEPFPTLLTESVSVTGIGRRLVSPGYPSRPDRGSRGTREVDVVCGACLLVRAAALAEIGLLDEEYGMYSEEPDLCLRMRRAGWRTYYHGAAIIRHHGGQSTRQNRREMLVALYRSKLRFFRRYRGPGQAALLRILFFCALVARGALSRLLGRRPPAPWVGWRELWPMDRRRA